MPYMQQRRHRWRWDAVDVWMLWLVVALLGLGLLSWGAMVWIVSGR